MVRKRDGRTRHIRCAADSRRRRLHEAARRRTLLARCTFDQNLRRHERNSAAHHFRSSARPPLTTRNVIIGIQREEPIVPQPTIYEAMSSLRAVRRLRPDPIPTDVLERVLQAAAWAPTGGN